MAYEFSDSTSLQHLFTDIVAQARFTAEDNSLLTGLVKTYDIGAQAGKVINIPKYGTASAVALTDGAEQEPDEVTTTEVAVTVGGVGASVSVTDMAGFGSAQNVVADLGTVLGNAIAKKMDEDIITLFANFGNAVGAVNTKLSIALLLEGIAKIRANSFRGQLACVLNPLQAQHLKAELIGGSGFNNPVANTAMTTGYIGSIAGCDVFEHASVAIDGNDDGVGAIFAPEAVAMAVKRDFAIEQQRNALGRSTELVATAYYGVAELEDLAGTAVTCSSVTA